MKIVLCSAFLRSGYTFSRYYHRLPALGIGYIAAYLEKKGHRDCSIIDRTLCADEAEALAREIAAQRPDVAGFYTVSENYKFVIGVMERLKEKNPGIITVIGGPHVYGMPEASVRPDCVDFGMHGEAEASFHALVESNFSPERLCAIDGLIYKKDGTVHVNRMALIHDLDALPFPARRLYPPLDGYVPSIITYKRLPATGMLTSRGCSSRCAFCHSGKGEFGLRFHSPEYVLEEMAHLRKDFGIKEFFIFDDTFAANRERAMRICEGMIKAMPGISWSCNAKVTHLDRELLRTMRRAGCWLLQIGVESGSQRILNVMKKGITLERVRAACADAYALGFHIKAFFIMGNAGETSATLDDTVRFMLSLPLHYSSINFLTPLPGTELWDTVERHGSFDKDRLEAVNYLSDSPAFIPRGLDERTLKRRFIEAYLRFYLSPATMLRNLKTLRSLDDAKRLAKASLLLSRLIISRALAGV